MKSENESAYFNPKYVASRHKIAKEFRDLAEQNIPVPEKNWSVIWALTGPEETFEEDAEAHPGEEHKTTDYNQTKRRFESALRVACEVTALRLGKEVSDVTPADIREQGPMVFWGGKIAVNNYFKKKFIESGELEKIYNFPVENIKITESPTIQHTDHQFADFPQDIIPEGDKVVIVSDLYHLPRVRRYLKKYKDKFPEEKSVLYPSQPSSLSPKMVLQEIRKIPPYVEKGILPAEDSSEKDKQ